MVQKKSLLSDIGKVAQDILSIVGVITILITVYKFIDNPFKHLKEPDVIVRPIYEQVPIRTPTYSDGKPAPYKLVGIEIKNINEVSDLRVKLSNISYIDQWIINSDKIPETDVKNTFNQLPTGNVVNKNIFIDLPRIMPKGTTVIEILGVVPADFDPTLENWFLVSSAKNFVLHNTYSIALPVREWSYKFDPSVMYEYFFWFAFAPFVFIYLIYVRIKKKRTPRAKPQLETKPAVEESGPSSEST